MSFIPIANTSEDPSRSPVFPQIDHESNIDLQALPLPSRAKYDALFSGVDLSYKAK